MFNVLPWVDGKYHIVDGVGKIATMDSNGVFYFETPVGSKELIELGKWLETTALPISNSQSTKLVIELVDKAPKRLISKGFKSNKNTPKSIALLNTAIATANKALAKPSRSKWAGVLDGAEHSLTLKETGYKDFNGFRSMMHAYSKKQGYSFTSSVDGKKIKFTCTKK